MLDAFLNNDHRAMKIIAYACGNQRQKIASSWRIVLAYLRDLVRGESRTHGNRST
jgi:hypothetical protein